MFAEEAKESQQLFEQVQEIKVGCDKALAECIPLMNAAIAALDTLNKKDIDEMKAYPNPPKLLKPVIEAVCLLQGVPETWDQGKKLMTDPKKFIDDLKNYKKDSIPEKILKKLKKQYIADPNFQPDIVKGVSLAGRGICLWVRAIDGYADVMKIVRPKQIELAKAEG